MSGTSEPPNREDVPEALRIRDEAVDHSPNQRNIQTDGWSDHQRHL